MQLRESMTTIIPWTRPHPDEYTFYYEYGLKQDIVNVEFVEEDDLLDYNNNPAIEVAFDVNGTMWPKYKKKSEISPYVLFSTVLDIIKDHQNNTGSEMYIYHPSNRALEKIYQKMIKRFMPRGWATGKWTSANGFEYVLIHKRD